MHTCLLCCLYYLTIRLRDEFSMSKLSTSVAGTEARVRSSIVLPSNWNKFSDWKKTGHVSWVWTNLLPRVNKTHKLPRETTTWTFDLHVIRSCSLKLRQNCEPASVKKKRIFRSFFYFWIGRYNKTLNDWPQYCGFRGNKNHCFPGGQSLIYT